MIDQDDVLQWGPKEIEYCLKICGPDKIPHKGMPPFDPSGPAVSFYEFWPPRLFYTPIALHILMMAIRFGGFTVLTNANPDIPSGGFVGESKTDILDAVGDEAAPFFAKHFGIIAPAHDENVAVQAGIAADQAELDMKKLDMHYPIVIKPDVGCRGIGVQIARNRDEIVAYLQTVPPHSRVLAQELIPFEGEAGVLYIRKPSEPRGQIFSITTKYFPYVQGDGKRTLRELIMADRRASIISHVYMPRHAKRLDEVIPDGENFRLAFAGSHSRGTIFRNGNAHITEAMLDRFEMIARDIPQFYFGRFDCRFENIDDLKAGKRFKIVEINGVGGESTHIWDRNTPLLEAWQTLMKQNRYLFEIGAENRTRGFKPMTIGQLWQDYRKEKRLNEGYPHTE